MVFDQGLHGGHTEPGYIDGVEQAARYFLMNLDKEFDLSIYSRTHHIACSHFKGKVNDTNCSSDEIDNFRTKEERCNSPIQSKEFQSLLKKKEELRRMSNFIQSYIDFCKIADDSGEDSDDSISTFHAMLNDPRVPEIMKARIRASLQETPAAKKERIEKNYEKAKKWIEETFAISCSQMTSEELSALSSDKLDFLHKELEVLARAHVKRLEEQFSLVQQVLKTTEVFINCIHPSDLSITIVYEPSTSLEEFTVKFIDRFNTHLNDLQKTTCKKVRALSQKTVEEVSSKASLREEYQEEVVKLIAELYAELEWLHPWIDGQGRTDLIMLNGLLCREGLNPSILDEPYFSTISTIEDWTSYLHDGIAQFKKLQIAQKS